MSPILVVLVIACYFGLLILISYFTSQKANDLSFFTGNRESPWFLVAFGMIGSSLSGVTFISVPGEVGVSQFSYFQVVLGYLLGYLVIATVLMPLYYRLNLVSIYGYLQQRFGNYSYKTGSFFFLVSRLIGSSFRLFLVAGVLQIALFNNIGVPFWATVLITIALIYLYTNKGGIKTIVWTDGLQTLFMLASVIVSIWLIARELDLGLVGLVNTVADHELSKIFFWEWKSGQNFFKQFLSGAFIAIVMTGLDQDMMQKNLSIKTLKDAQKNMFWFSLILVFVNFLFLSLGVLLYTFSVQNGITLPGKTDDLYPLLALNHFNIFAAVVFILGITAAAYSSADSTLTALTTSFCVDFLGFKLQDDPKERKTRKKVHLFFSLLTFFVILAFQLISDDSVIVSVFKAAGYTYGPLLGLFSFGMFTKWAVKDRWVPVVCILAPSLSFLINLYSETLLFGYQFGFEVLILNGLLTFFGLWMVRKRE